ncbi:MAG: hypothetical protein WCJ70_02620 [bacterium]
MPAPIDADASVSERFIPPFNTDLIDFAPCEKVQKYTFPSHENLNSSNSRVNFPPVVFLSPYVEKPASGEINYVSNDLDSIIELLKDKYQIEVPPYLTSESPIWSPEKRGIMEALLATSIYTASGEMKLNRDSEGVGLVFAWLLYSESRPDISHAIMTELTTRRSMLSKLKPKGADLSEYMAKNLEFKGVPFNHIYCTHATDYPPHNQNGKSYVLPRIDMDGLPRSTIHTFVNGVVEPVNVTIATHSWERRKYLILMNFANVIRTNGLPYNFVQSDTYWHLNPGTGLELPRGSTIFLPKGDSAQTDIDTFSGIRIVEYDPTIQDVRSAAKEFCEKHNYTFDEKVHNNYSSGEERQLAEKLGVHPETHFNGKKLLNENILIGSERYIANAKDLDAFKKSPVYTSYTNYEKFRRIYPNTHQIDVDNPQLVDEYRKNPLKLALGGIKRDLISRAFTIEYYKSMSEHNEEVPLQDLMAAYIKGFL